MFYGITLHKYYNEIADMVQAAEMLIESQQDVTVALSDSIPPMPPIPEEVKSYTKSFIPKILTLVGLFSQLKKFKNAFFSPRSLDCEVEVPELSHGVAKQVLSRCVAVMLAHSGFECKHFGAILLFSIILFFFACSNTSKRARSFN